MSPATASPVPASPVVTVVPPQPVRERGMRPRLLSIPTSERLSDAATIEPLIKMISGKIRKGRRSVFKEVGLDDGDDRGGENHPGDLLRPSCSQKNEKTPEEAERKFGELSNIHPRHHNTAPQPPTAASDLSPSSQDSRPRQRQNSLPNQPWYTRLTRPKGRPRVRSVSGTPPATLSGFHQFTLAAMLLTLFLPSCHIHSTRPGLEAMVTDASVLSKRALSPVDVCLRWAHQAANVNGTLYIYGGEAREEDDQHENTWNNNFLTLDLSSDWSVDSPALVGLEKPNGPPAVALGYLWQDYNNLYLYGGQFSDSPYTEPAPESIWRYSISSKSWTEFPNPKTSEGNYSDSAGEPVHRASEGAGASVPELGLSFYFGGHLDWATTPGWSRDIKRVYLKSLLEFTHPGYANSGVNALRGKGAGQSGAFRNITSTPVQQNNFPERADGVLVYVPGWGELGVLIGLAGGTAEDFTYDLRRLDVYDIASSQWFHQETSGEIPSVRVNPCATVASAPDASSFQIYLFGGQNLQPYGNQTQYNDMFILTIPSFTWIKVEPSDSTPGPRAGHTCTMWDGQVVVVGGYIGNDYKCDSPGIHVFDASKLKWKDTFAAGDHPPDFHADNMVLAASNGYSVPDPVQKVIGGNQQGGATVTTPASGPATDGPFATGKPPVFTVTQSGGITTVTPTSEPGSGQDEPEVSPGLVATGIIAGIAGVLAFYLGFCAWLYRRQVSVYKQHLTDAKRYSRDRVVASGPQDGPYQASGAAQNDENIRESKNASAWEDFSTGPAWLSEPKWASWGESSSFKHGFFDDTIESVEMILGNGEVVKASRKERADLFEASAGAMGTLGMTTLIELRLIEAKRFVHTTYHRVNSVSEAIKRIQEETKNPENDYVDGIIFSRSHGAIITGRLSDEKPAEVAPQTFSGAWDPWFYMHVRERTAQEPKPVDYIPLGEYLFRYDRAGFWVGQQAFVYFWMVPFTRFFRWFLDDFLHTRMLYRALHASGESGRFVVQDLALPYDTAEDFIDYTTEHFDIWPLWLCPLKQHAPPTFHPFTGETDKDGSPKDILNIGLWGWGPRDPKEFVAKNRDLEDKLVELNGKKWFYAHTYYPEGEFWKMYDRKWYDGLREKYHATTLPTVYDKVHVDINARSRELQTWRQWIKSVTPLGGLYGIYRAIQTGDYNLHRHALWKYKEKKD